MSKMQSLINALKKSKKTVAITAAIVAVAAIVGIFTPSLSAKDFVYVDANNKGSQTGSASNPFRTIQDGINKAKSEKKNVFVQPGLYVENIEIKEDVEVHGANKDRVTIIAANKHEAVVTMEDDTEIRKVTIKGGNRGVEVEKNAKVTIEKAKIIENKKDGIKVKEGKTDKDHRVTIFDCEITDNGWSGIYAEKRDLVIMENEILENDWDGIDLAAGVEAYVADNQVRLNDRDGMEVTLDGSEIWTKNNTFYDNGDDGIEVKARGKAGKLGVEKTKFYKNDSYAISRVEKVTMSNQLWNGIIMGKENKFWENKKGDISPIIEAR